MSSYARALELVAELTAAGITATADPRAATPPCVLVTPPRRTYDLGCNAYTARWQLFALVPGTGNADAHKQLDALVDDVAAVLVILSADLASYTLAPDNPPLPAYRLELEEALDGSS